MIPTTDQMDSTTAEERKKLVAMCEHCGDWKHYNRLKVVDEDGRLDPSPYAGLHCDNCNGTKFRDVISERTFDKERAKKATAKWLKARKK